MKVRLFSIFAIITLLFYGCKKEDPEIATIDELATLALSESFMAQPISINNNLVAIINKDDMATLCTYDINGNKLWNQSIENYTLNGYTMHDVTYLDLQKSVDNQVFINMYYEETATNAISSKQSLKTIKFSNSGQFLWEMQDTVHQPDTIIVGLDTIDIRANNDFSAGGFLSFSDGSTAIISSQISRTIGDDNTYIQLSRYDTNGQFIADKYLKLPARWNILSAYTTSTDNIFIFSGNNLGTRTLKMIDLQGNLIFEKTPSQNLYEIYFFAENSQGNYIISAAYFENTDVANGIVISADKTGNILWDLPYKSGPQSGFMRSMQERSDGYIFTGFSSPSALFDWRDDATNTDYKAIIQKTDLNGALQWENTFNANFNSAGAGTLGSSDFSFFIGKKDGPLKNILLLKLDSQGNIKN